MATTIKKASEGPLTIFSGSLMNYVLRLLALMVIDGFASWLIFSLFGDGSWTLAAILFILTIGINVIFLREDLYPVRWIAPGLFLLILMVLYPVLFTMYIGFTNYGDGHLLNKEQAIRIITQEQYLPEDAPTYEWVAYRSEEEQYKLALILEDGQVLLSGVGEAPQPIVAGEGGVGELDEDGIPETIVGYERLARKDLIKYLSELDELEFGDESKSIKIRSLSEAASSEPRYAYEEAQDGIIDQQDGTIYTASSQKGNFISEEGEALRPGYRVVVGFDNFRRITSSPALRGPFIRVFIWTFVFATLSVLTSFALGLGLALVFNDPELPGRKIIRSLLIIPYTIPSVITILIWRGLLNPKFGVVNNYLDSLFGISPAWFSDPIMAKVAILLINLWLGFPYMMLISTGALQAVPQDIYEAASVDGANAWQSFWGLTLPLLLVSLGPLLISSFAFNFNNFNVIFLYNEGGPPISGAPTPAGHTDILLSYTYRLAFGGGRGADYGFASAITMVIFLLVGTVTFFQFRYTKFLEEISENV